MEDGIDLRELVRALLRHKMMIVVLTVVAALAGFAAGSVTKPVYRATALVSLADLPYTIRLEQVTQKSAIAVRTYPELAVSDEVLAGLLESARSALPPEVTTVSKLRAKLRAETGTDPALLRLAAVSEVPADAMTIANTWATLLAERAAALYGPDTGQVAQYREQLALAKQALDQAERALTAFESENQAPVLQAQLASQQLSLTDYLNRQHRYRLLLTDAQNLLNRLEQQGASAAASPFDEAALLVLVAQASGNTEAETSTSAPQIQIVVGGAPSGQTVGQLMDSVRTFIDDLRIRTDDASGQAEALGPAILTLQGQVAEASAMGKELHRASDLAENEYLSLAAKVEQVTIAAQDSVSNVRIASRASLPTAPSGLGRALPTLLAAVLGCLLGVVSALILEWWRAPSRKERGVPLAKASERATVA
jgi:succinoglycan biosynthesis transport protein ExoP